MRTLLNGAAICCATFAIASCAPTRTASVPALPAPALAAAVPAKPVPAIAAPVPAAPSATASVLPTPAPSASDRPIAAPRAAASASASALFGMRLVALHNDVREAVGVAPITWDSSLAAAANSYAEELAKTGRWAHSPRAERPGQGENLWMGTHGAFSLGEMVGAWADEGRMFHAGAFPQVSKTGNWDDVGHYTQMIWPGSIRVGCAERSSAHYDYLVCRYSPAGNVMGSRALEAMNMRRNTATALNVAARPVTSNSILD